MGEAARENAEFQEDRDDDDDEEDEQSLGDSMAYTKTIDSKQLSSEEQSSLNRADMMWNDVINRHGKDEFNSVYSIMQKYSLERFKEQPQILIQDEVSLALPYVTAAQRSELIGLVSSYMIMEEYKA